MAKAAARELLPGQKRFGAGPLAADITDRVVRVLRVPDHLDDSPCWR